MRRSSNIVVAIGSAVILLVAGAIFTINISRSTLWKDDETFSTIDAANEIRIYDNDYGAPHIVAENDNDMFYAIGFTHARDRLWQMEYNRRLAAGRLSEIFGGKSLDGDKFMRALELESLARRIHSRMSKRSRLILRAYSAGVNEFISRYKSKFSYEFGALSFEPEPWRPEDCIMIQRLFALELSRAFWTEPHLTALADKIGPSRMASLLPNDNLPPYFLESNASNAPDSAAQNALSYLGRGNFDNFAENNAPNDEALEKYIGSLSGAAKLLGISSGPIGSNAWACNKNADKRAIFAADPHNALSLPAKWYELHVTSEGINTIGLTLPGFPMFFIGRNDNYAFGFSSYSGDDCDFYFEKFDETGKKIILPDGSKRDVAGEADTIKIRDGQPLIYYARRGRHSRILTDIDFFGGNDFTYSQGSRIKSFVRKRALSFRWTGMETSDEVDALYKINFGKKWQDFTAGAAQWNAPAVNFIYADKNGSIGLSAAGRLPERSGERRFAYGYLQPDWTGLSRLPNPNVYNPTSKVAFAANNAPGKSAAGYFEPSSRAQRIKESIDSIADYTLRDAQLTQSDVGSPYADEIIKLTVPLLNERINGMTLLEKSALHRFKTWDRFISASSVASTIYSAFIHKLIVNIYRDELGPYGFERYTSLASIPLRRLPEELKKDSSLFMDDRSTDKIERRQNIIFKSFRDAVEMCRDSFKSENIWDWRYGKLHKLTLQNGHSIGLNYKTGFKPIELELSGSFSTINSTSWDINKPFAVTLASSARFVADMRDSVVYMSIPGGESGDAMSPNYTNQIQLWKNGGYLRLPFGREPGAGFKLSVTIKPKI
ncbi:MAG: penicillin acylase family protein [Chloroflexota bacterium]